jgi:hypothetical protein
MDNAALPNEEMKLELAYRALEKRIQAVSIAVLVVTCLIPLWFYLSARADGLSFVGPLFLAFVSLVVDVVLIIVWIYWSQRRAGLKRQMRQSQ